MKSETYKMPPNFMLDQRSRRLRRTESLRELVRETRLSTSDLIYPIFVDARIKAREEIVSMPGISRLSLSELSEEAKEISALNIPAVLIFGLPQHKDAKGTEAYAHNGIVQNAVRMIKKAAPQLTVVTDVCMCEYTDHGHCGIVSNRTVVNDLTLELLSRTAVSHAEAGADMVGPSAMMDGQVKAIRTALDESGLTEVAIMSYSAKYASSFYGPFREAAESAPLWGDRCSYQMDPPNRRDAMREIAEDIRQGADIVMVKPALSYLDVIRDARVTFPTSLAAYNVSGEYSMVKAAEQRGWIDGQRVALEILTSIKRAGADIIITYFAKEFARRLKETKL